MQRNVFGSSLIEAGQSAHVNFERLIVLALDLQFGLQFFDEQFEARDFRAKFLHVDAGGRRALRCGRERSGYGRCRRTRRERIGQGARPGRVGARVRQMRWSGGRRGM